MSKFIHLNPPRKIKFIIFPLYRKKKLKYVVTYFVATQQCLPLQRRFLFSSKLVNIYLEEYYIFGYCLFSAVTGCTPPAHPQRSGTTLQIVLFCNFLMALRRLHASGMRTTSFICTRMDSLFLCRL